MRRYSGHSIIKLYLYLQIAVFVFFAIRGFFYPGPDLKPSQPFDPIENQLLWENEKDTSKVY
jgi:hypothetical protein